jgi:hypothetical protein
LIRRAAPGVAPRRTADGFLNHDAAFIAQERPQAQVVAAQPIELRDPLADDKLALFALPAVHRLCGRWQGPGSIERLRRWAS